MLQVLGTRPLQADAATEFTLSEFLDQVKQKNLSITSAIHNSSGALERAGESRLITAPQLFANTTLSSDAGPSTSIPRDKAVFNTYTLGVAQQFAFGLSAKLFYNVNYTSISGISPVYAQLVTTPLHTAKPALELTQSLWRNFLGSETQATQTLVHSSALATHYAEAFKIKLVLADAEVTYWRLALARDTINLSKENLDRAIKLRDWSARRVTLQLTDRTDLLQAEAALQLRQLELQTAQDEVAASMRAFNSARGLDSDAVPEKLPALSQTALSEIQTPVRSQFREDVLAAQQAEQIAVANSRLGNEKNTPNFEAFAQLALNGWDASLSPSLTNSLQIAHPTTAIGVRFSTPLDLGTLKQDRAGYAQEKSGAEEALQRKYFEQERDWKDLNSKLEETRKRLQLSQKLEAAQKEKLTIEKERLNHGRTTTYQVLLFEQDYAQAQLGRIQTEAALLRIIAQMRTFSAGGAL